MANAVMAQRRAAASNYANAALQRMNSTTSRESDPISADMQRAGEFEGDMQMVDRLGQGIDAYHRTRLSTKAKENRRTSMSITVGDTVYDIPLDDPMNPAKVPPFVFLPTSRPKLVWDWLGAVLILYTSILVPWEFAFQPDVNFALLAANVFVDFYFILDLFLNFRVAVCHESGQWIYSSKLIALLYFKKQFWIDAILSVPFEPITRALGGSSAARAFSIFRCVRLVRLGRVSQKTEELGVFPNMFKLIKLLSVYLLTAHWAGCAYYFLGRYQDPSANGNGNPPWIVVKGLVDASVNSRWITSIYWAMTTLVTGGLE